MEYKLKTIEGTKSSLIRYFDSIKKQGVNYRLNEEEFQNLLSLAQQFCQDKMFDIWTHGIVLPSIGYGSLCLWLANSFNKIDISPKRALQTNYSYVVACMRKIIIAKKNICEICGKIETPLHLHHEYPLFAQIAKMFISVHGDNLLVKNCENGRLVGKIGEEWKVFHDQHIKKTITCCVYCHKKLHEK